MFTITFGWWLAPLAFTVFILAAWRLFGVRMQPSNGSMFPDAGGAILEIGGYLVAFLLSAIAWLVWALLA